MAVNMIAVMGIPNTANTIQNTFPPSDKGAMFPYPEKQSCISDPGRIVKTKPVNISQYLITRFLHISSQYILSRNEGALLLATQNPNIPCYSPPSYLRRICARNNCTRCRNKQVKIVLFLYILKRLFTSSVACGEMSNAGHLHFGG